MASPPKPSTPEMSLDDQIALAEQAVIERDLRIRLRAGALVRHAKREAVKHAGGGLLLGALTVGLAWWFNRATRRNEAAQPAAAPQQQPQEPHTFEHLFRDAGLTLAGLLPVLWPMLPRAWRRVVSPGTASTVLTFLAPMLGKLFRRKPKPGQAA